MASSLYGKCIGKHIYIYVIPPPKIYLFCFFTGIYVVLQQVRKNNKKGRSLGGGGGSIYIPYILIESLFGMSFPASRPNRLVLPKYNKNPTWLARPWK